MNSTTQELHDFGYRFIGPVVTAFFDKVLACCSGHEPKTLYFLAREGYFLKQLFDHYQVISGCRPELKSQYLLCSRAFLFKLALADKKLIPSTLQHHYKGSLLNFLTRRFGFSGADINKIMVRLPHITAQMESEVKLPSEAVRIEKVLTDISQLFRSELQAKSELYAEYLKGLGFRNGPLNVLDIGFTGTIQTLLSAMTGESTIGHYMVTTSRAKDTDSCQYYGHLSSGQSFGKGYPMIDRSLYLESVLTAPHGQIIDIFSVNGQSRFGFAQKTRAQHHFEILQQINEGAVSYMQDVLPDETQLAAEDIPEYYAGIVADPASFPMDLRAILEVDDHISGFGVLNPAQLFG
ncbi:hypothetical protein ACQUQU_09685 [Thalassolituus sp. LLYu03]|uniref:hypothetical protein n=1 Tax=Thalassolituus sp. LLYu03 TaxID=3421656 RepID=UPI003D2A16A4